ncbi:MAG: transglutaminase domain-containing protein [Clostridia bacterium]|nr:transglutaminase domain-containing protein [Clostridia bacterium]
MDEKTNNTEEVTKEITEETPEALTEAVSETISEEKTSEAPKKRFRVLQIIIAAALVLILAFGALIVCAIAPQKSEIGESIQLRCKQIPLISELYTVETELSGIDVNALGKHDISISLFGFLPLKTTLAVCDTTPPRVVTRNVIIPAGGDIEASDFIDEALDKTALTYSLSSLSSTDSGGDVMLTVTDEGGNTVYVSASYSISDKVADRTFELSITDAQIKTRMLSEFRLDRIDLTAVDASACGSYRVSGEVDGKTCVFKVNIVDTIAPTASVRAFDLLLGQTVDIQDIVTDIVDASDVSVSCEPELDFTETGKREYAFTLTDENGNSTEYSTVINIHAMAPSIVIEAGTTADALAATISMMLGTDEALPRLSDSFDYAYLDVGTYEVELIGEYSEIPLEIIVEDTVPPEFTLRPITVYTGTSLPADAFVIGYTDFAEVSFKFTDEPDFAVVGNYIVTIIGTDAAGNTTEKSTTLKVSRDNVPPTIYGVKNITAYEGDTVSYRSGVYAIDEKDGRLTVKADSSKVNTSKAGTYYVTYTAADTDGNTSTATATVTIKAVTTAVVYEKADEVLATIINGSMTDTQKARAIYDWCTSNLKYSTSTSHLMGYFNKAAYSGFTRHYGNCYTYYAVASALLTRAGISNIEIHRNDPKNPHYWNLVNIDGSWYHFDTCPQPAPHKLEVFLLTDAQVGAFSLDYYYKFAAGVYPATP